MDGGTVVLLKLTTAMEIDNMSSIQRDFPQLFETVSKVLGEEEAEKQLSIAYESSDGYNWEDSQSLMFAFSWGDTEQDHDYWQNIHGSGGTLNE